MLVGVALASPPMVAVAQVMGGVSASSTFSSQPTSSTAATTVVRTVQGRVVNALDGAAVARVLVTLNSRAVLTDAQGRFAFPEFSDAQAFVTLTRPGFSQSNRSSAMMGRGSPQRVANLDAPLELKIYPDAIITGTVTGRDGLPLTHVQVQLRRLTLQGQGTQMMMTGAAQTNLRGEYRFRQPPGRYQLIVGYVQRDFDTGQAVLPETFPQSTGSDTPAFITVGSGEEKHIDLRPRTGPCFPVQVKVDAPEAQRMVQFTAATSTGEVFNVGFAGQSSPGTSLLSLPAGNYLLRGRLTGKDLALSGTTKVSVTGPTNDPVVLHLEPVTSLPVELAIDSASAGASSFAAPTSTSTGAVSALTTQSTAPPDLRQFNLRLVSLTSQNGNGQDEQIQAQQREDKTYEFRVAAGRYRLEANGGGRWYVESATYGVANLMSSDITIASGGSSAAIRLVVNNIKGTVQATVAMPANGEGTFVYMIPRGPSLNPINPMQIYDNGSGTGTGSLTLPVGSYTAVATDHAVDEDLRDPDVMAKFSTNTKQVDIAASATVTVALQIAAEKETAP